MRRLLLAATLLLGACGSGGEADAGDVLADAEEHLASVESGSMALALEASTPASGAPVGFRVEGPFSFEGGGELAVLDLTYTQVLGEEEIATTMVSTGERAWVVQDGEAIEVPEAQAAALRVDGDHGGVPSLDLAGWFVDPELDGERVTGEVDAAALLADLHRLAAEVDGQPVGEELDDEAADRLRELVRASEAELVTTGEGEVRELRAVVDFGARVPDELRASLGDYAGARLALTLRLEPLDGPLEVQPPT